MKHSAAGIKKGRGKAEHIILVFINEWAAVKGHRCGLRRAVILVKISIVKSA